MSPAFEMLMKEKMEKKKASGNKNNSQLSFAEKTYLEMKEEERRQEVARKRAEIEKWLHDAMLPVAIILAALLLRPIRK